MKGNSTYITYTVIPFRGMLCNKKEHKIHAIRHIFSHIHRKAISWKESWIYIISPPSYITSTTATRYYSTHAPSYAFNPGKSFYHWAFALYIAEQKKLNIWMMLRVNFSRYISHHIPLPTCPCFGLRTK